MGDSNSVSRSFSGKTERNNTNALIGIIIFVGAFIHLCFTNYFSVTGSFGPATALLWGYMIIIFAIFFKMILSAKTSSFESFNASSTFQTMFLLSMMLWLVVLNVQYMFQLNTGKAPASYYSYSWWTTLFIFIQIIFYMIKDIAKDSQSLSSYYPNEFISIIFKNTNAISLVTLFLIFVLIFIQHTILTNFSVDVL